MSVQPFNQVAYGLTQPGISIFPSPIVSNRAPTTADKSQIGATWVNVPANDYYVLTSIVANSATWQLVVAGVGSIDQVTASDGGIVLPAAGNINATQGLNILTTGAGSTLTIATVASPVFTGLRVSTLTAGVVQTDATGVFSSSKGTDGQVLVSSTVGVPAWAILTEGTNISIANGPNTITISANTGASSINYIATAVTPYVATATDNFIAIDCSGGAKTVQLPNAPATGRTFVIKDYTGNSSVNNITVTTVGGAVLIDLATTFIMNTDYEAVSVLFDGTKYEIY